MTMKRLDLRQHILASYVHMRIGMAVLAILLPIVLYVGGKLRADLDLLGSMSAYYHGGQGAMRDVLVGVLCAVGAFLYLYKGINVFENIALNLAGIFIAAAALVPMQWECEQDCQRVSPHFVFAVLF